MSLSAGSLTINPDGSETVISPGWGVDLYFARKAATLLPDPNHKKGCVTTAAANPGDTTLSVDDTSGYQVGDSFSNFNYVDPSPPHGALTVSLHVATIPDGTHIIVDTPVPSGVTIPSGTAFGFRGTLAQWTAQVLPQLVRQEQQLASAAIADATVHVNQLTTHAEVSLAGAQAVIAPSLGGLQTSTGTGLPTAAPLAEQTIPVAGTGSIT